MQHSQLLFDFRKSNKVFSYTIFPGKKINVGEVLKLRENFYLIFLSIHILKLEISGCDKSGSPSPFFGVRAANPAGTARHHSGHRRSPRAALAPLSATLPGIPGLSRSRRPAGLAITADPGAGHAR
jgi:hypothetical protein